MEGKQGVFMVFIKRRYNMRKFSNAQRYDVMPNKYRIKDYETNEWSYIEKAPQNFRPYKWIVRNKTFKTITELNNYYFKKNGKKNEK